LSFRAVSYNAQIHVAVRPCFAPGVGTKEIDRVDWAYAVKRLDAFAEHFAPVLQGSWEPVQTKLHCR
jgi:hypothetical protein